jgi:hypothetical protein
MWLTAHELASAAWAISTVSLFCYCLARCDPRPAGCSLVWFGIAIHSTKNNDISKDSMYTMLAFGGWGLFMWLWFFMETLHHIVLARWPKHPIAQLRIVDV